MKKNSPLYVIIFMIAISGVFGIAVSMVQYLTQGRLEANARLYRNRTVAWAFELEVPNPTPTGYEEALDEHLKKLEFAEGDRLWQIFIRVDAPHDVGFVFVGMGFWDVIRGVLVLSPDLQHIKNIEFLDQKETPGLGARIEEEWFKGQFEGYRIDWDAPEGEKLEFGEEREGEEISAITGATQTSMALERILNRELSSFREIYRKKNIDQLKQPINTEPNASAG